MGKALSSDLRERVYGDVALGKSRRAAARRFGVSASTGVRLAQRMAETGHYRRGAKDDRAVAASWRPTGIG